MNKLIGQYSCILIWIIILDAVKSASISKTPLWTWECKMEKCVPRRYSKSIKLQSLETCNMLCSPLPIWPVPTGAVSLSVSAIPVRADQFYPNILSAPSQAVRDYLQSAFHLFVEDLHARRNYTGGPWYRVNIHFTVKRNSDPLLRLDTDEGYVLSIQPKREENSIFILIDANSFCGARHGLETLSQIIWVDPYSASLMMMEAAKVEDAPRFRYRGIMLDTARHHFPLKDLIRMIDVMAAYKLNTFHWHASDAQSFSLLLDGVPQMTHYGAFGYETVYTEQEIQVLVQRARLRGIRVIIEIDAPAHVGLAWDWGMSNGLGYLAYCNDLSPWSNICSEPPCGHINPENPYVYDFLQKIYAAIIRLTGVNDIFHLGGDDISTKCWEMYHNTTDPFLLWLNFTNKALDSLYKTDVQPELVLLWSSNLNHRLSELRQYIKNLGIQTRDISWNSKYSREMRTIISHEDAWDFNTGLGSWSKTKGGRPFNSWQKVYEHRPWLRETQALIEGGEATVWSHNLDNGGLDSHVWLRAAALAERLWSDRPEGATRSVHARLDIHRSRLLTQGIRVSPLWSMWCTQNTYTCG